MCIAKEYKIVLVAFSTVNRVRNYNLDLSERYFVVLKGLSTEIFNYSLSKTYSPSPPEKNQQNKAAQL